jgi:putative exporter of polyketide antibiotics
MFHFLAGLFSIIGLIVTAAGALFAFGLAREYVRNRLRFVDAVRHPLTPWITWLLATIVLTPIVAILPVVGFGTAVLIGGAAGLGTSSGVKALKRGD